MENPQKIADELMARASIAAGIFQQFDQQQTDRIVENVFNAFFKHRVRLAKLAQEETGMGKWEDKVIKNVLGSMMVYNDIKDMKTVGTISEDDASGIVEIAQPLGPIFAMIPVTNPTSTAIYKVLISLKTRNPIIISPHRRAMNCCRETAEICYQAALEAGAPDDCIQIITEHSRDLTHALMSNQRLALILATGGTGLVHAAYSSGNPALGVGPGNVPVFIDKSADIPFAVANIIISKTFDNGTICASEQSVVVEKEISDKVKEEFIRQGCYFLTSDEIRKVEAIAVEPGTLSMTAEVVGQPVNKIAEMAGVVIPDKSRILMAELDGVGPDFPLSGEVLAPILAFYTTDDYDNAIKTCIDINYIGGVGHTAAIYANNEERIKEFSELMNAGRVVVNTPSTMGAVGGLFNTLNVSFTLGCGSGGKNITTENITATHLINVKRVTRRRINQKWAGYDAKNYYNEGLDASTVISGYNKNS